MGKKHVRRSRELQFSDWDDVIHEVEELLEHGYTTTGNWTLGQASSHLAQWTTFPINGFPKSPFVIRLIFSTMNRLGVTRRLREKILNRGFQPGSPTKPSTVPSAKLPDREGVHQLKNAYMNARSHEGPLYPSPLFGEMTPEVYKRVSLLHAAHHLGFFQPEVPVPVEEPATHASA